MPRPRTAAAIPSVAAHVRSAIWHGQEDEVTVMQCPSDARRRSSGELEGPPGRCTAAAGGCFECIVLGGCPAKQLVERALYGSVDRRHWRSTVYLQLLRCCGGRSVSGEPTRRSSYRRIERDGSAQVFSAAMHTGGSRRKLLLRRRCL